MGSCLEPTLEPPLAIESWSETLDYAPDQCSHMAKVAEKQGPFRIAERYLDGRLRIHVHFRVRPTGAEPDASEFCAVIGSREGDVLHLKNLAYVPESNGIPREEARILAFAPVGHHDRRCDRENTSDMDIPMLVHIVEPRKKGEIRLRRAFSVLKGLDRLDRCPIIQAYAAKHPFARLIPLPSFVDGELGLSGGTTAPQENELPKEIVERGPQVVAELPDDEPDTGIGQVPDEMKDIFAGIAVELTDNSAVLLTKEGGPRTIERVQVLVRSFCQVG